MFRQIFVEERDAYMTHALHTLLIKNSAEKRLSWERTDAVWQPLRIIKMSFRLAFWGAVGYMLYRGGVRVAKRFA
uniref:Glycosyl transferase n=1 Tax=Heterorhabditis bacteriophora TaxID=37862 RepID=A0A1I7WMT1_HETBA